MLTLKLMNDTTGRVSIVECSALDVVREKSVVRLLAQMVDGVKEYRISKMAESEYNVAYVENAWGSTTQTVRAY